MLLLLGVAELPAAGASSPATVRRLLDRHCVECHDAEMRKGGLDLTALAFDLEDAKTFDRWVGVHDRVVRGEMPPPKKPRPPADEVAGFTRSLAASLTDADESRRRGEGRAVRRRLNRYEYENAVRDLLGAPWLQVRDALPEDGEAHRFNKSGQALDFSHVQVARYLAAAEAALRQVVAPQTDRPDAAPRRYYARDQRSYTGPMKFSEFNTAPERATFPVLGFAGQPEVRAGKAPLTVGTNNPVERELEGVGVVASAYEPIEPKFNQFRAPMPGRYKLRFNAYSVWVGPGESNRWYIPNLDRIERGRRDEPVVIYSEAPPHQLRWLGHFDVTPEPAVHELDVWLLAGETIRPDAARLFRSRPGPARWQNPLAERDGQPGVVFRWLEVEGPIWEQWPPPGHALLFDTLAMTNRPAAANRNPRRDPGPPGVEILSTDPVRDAERLLARFVARAYRRPVNRRDALPYVPVVRGALERGASFTDAMIAGYTAVLASPEFLSLDERPGRLEGPALATRLALFLWNSPPDAELRALGEASGLDRPAVLRAQTERLLRDDRAGRFIEAFLDYWLDLRRIQATAPDATLYPDYYLDDLLVDSALEETRAFFAELVERDHPARTLVAADFALLNERLALHYGLPAVQGVSVRRVALPAGSPRGGLMTQAAVLKVTANGTTTSPVLRGAWILERILGQKPPPPPPSVPAVEPDIRGATTIRQQLAKHRDLESCAGCHAKIDPPGFALESFDVLGGWRDRYRAEGNADPAKGIAKSGQKFEFSYAQPVDASGQFADGRPFADIHDFKQLLLEDERQIARSLVRHLLVFATGTPPGFADRARVEQILDRAQSSGYGVATLIRELVQSELFRHK